MRKVEIEFKKTIWANDTPTEATIIATGSKLEGPDPDAGITYTYVDDLEMRVILPDGSEVELPAGSEAEVEASNRLIDLLSNYD